MKIKLKFNCQKIIKNSKEMADLDKEIANPDNQDEEESESKQKVEETAPEPEQEPEPLESDQEILNRIFMGEFENLPPQASKLVRIFTSSTFTGIIIIRYSIKRL